MLAAFRSNAVFEKCRPVIVSKGELVQVFSNIICQTRWMPCSTVVCCVSGSRRHRAGKGVRVAIQDHGIGIAQEHLAKIFEPFFTTKSDAGTGIGLWITRAVGREPRRQHLRNEQYRARKQRNYDPDRNSFRAFPARPDKWFGRGAIAAGEALILRTVETSARKAA